MMRSRWISCSITSAILVVALTLSAHAATIHVPADQPTIQAGIDAAAYGDTVLVACGVYVEYNIAMKSGICLTSETGQADCATIEVQPDWFVPVIVCVDVDSSTTIRGFTIAGSYFPVGAMGCHNSSPTITNVTFTDNYGGALYCVGSSPTLQDVAFLENWDYNPGYGGCGMYCEDSSVTLTDCRFVANEDHGMMCLDSSVTLTDCTFLGNAGPGMSCGGSSVLLATGCEFAENAGGAVFHGSQDGDYTLTDCRFVENAGGGMSCGTSGALALTLAGCSFMGNTAVGDEWDGCGGGLCLEWGEGADITLANCSFADNTADDSGGGLYAGITGSTSLTNCTFASNTAGEGGGLYAADYASTSLTDCTFVLNTAEGNGGAAAFFLAHDPTFSGCTIVENDASSGGAIYCDGFMGWGDATITNTIIAFNTGEAPLAFGLNSGSSCNDFYGNEGGDPSWCGSDGNICEDPLFCLDENPDAPYTLQVDSPCAAGNNRECGQIGAWGVGCESVTPVQAASWGAIKAMFR